MIKENTSKKQMESPPNLSVGSLVDGKVVARDRSSLFVDLGPEGTGVIYGREFYEVKDAIKNINIGDTINAKIIELENEDGYIELSLKDAAKEIGWQKLSKLKDKEEIIKVKINGVNKGGLLTDIGGIPAFLPVSQLSPENYPRVQDADKQKILKELQKFIGKTLEVKVLDLLASENKLILSEKAKTEENLKEVLSNYKKGDVVEGKITGVADFGVFIKFPITEELKNEETKKLNAQIEGLIHISELDWQLVNNPSEIVKVGQVVKAQIIDINNNQVFLSLKRLKENPWLDLEKKYKKGDVIKGKVISFSQFGVFVEVLLSPPEILLGENLENTVGEKTSRERSSEQSKSKTWENKVRGLCHISEFKSQKEMEEALKIGETYNFEILLIEPKDHRMSLKLAKK